MFSMDMGEAWDTDQSAFATGHGILLPQSVWQAVPKGRPRLPNCAAEPEMLRLWRATSSIVGASGASADPLRLPPPHFAGQNEGTLVEDRQEAPG
jgi:hypothetical protein